MARAADDDSIIQVTGPRGVALSTGAALPESDGTGFSDITVDGESYRMLTREVSDGGVVQVARSTAETEEVVRRLVARFSLIALMVAAAAAAIGWFFASRTTSPLRRLAAVANDVARTGDVTVTDQLDSDGRVDEIGSLTDSFRSMLDALAASRSQQHRLIHDAGHELRSPLTSMRANVQMLERAPDLPADQRAEIVTAIGSELGELNDLFGEPYNNEPFVRGDKLEPVRKLPAFWLNPADTKLAETAAKTGKGDMMSLLQQKQKAKLAANDRPFVGKIRHTPDATQRLMTVLVVNTTADPLVLKEAVLVTAGGMVSKPVVATYPNMTSTTSRPTAGFESTNNAASFDEKSWVDAAPTAAMGAGTATVGVWQFVGVKSDGAASFSIKFGPMPTAGYTQLYIGGSFPKDASANCCAVGIADHQLVADFHNQYVVNKTAALDTSSTCHASVSPADNAAGGSDVILTVYIA